MCVYYVYVCVHVLDIESCVNYVCTVCVCAMCECTYVCMQVLDVESCMNYVCMYACACIQAIGTKSCV